MASEYLNPKIAGGVLPLERYGFPLTSHSIDECAQELSGLDGVSPYQESGDGSKWDPHSEIGNRIS